MKKLLFIICILFVVNNTHSVRLNGIARIQKTVLSGVCPKRNINNILLKKIKQREKKYKREERQQNKVVVGASVGFFTLMYQLLKPDYSSSVGIVHLD